LGEIPDAKFYNPLFSPWEGYGEFPHYYGATADRSLVSKDRCHVLYQLALQALSVAGDFWECGVYKGGTAAMLAEILARHSGHRKRLCLFDTFAGMPDTDPERDTHKPGDFSDTDLDSVKEAVGHADLVSYHAGRIPQIFRGLGAAEIALAHIDVDIHRSVMDCCTFIFPRLSCGGFFDDYGFPCCPGARAAVDAYFAGTDSLPSYLRGKHLSEHRSVTMVVPVGPARSGIVAAPVNWPVISYGCLEWLGRRPEGLSLLPWLAP
jgi:O-methyltransferase